MTGVLVPVATSAKRSATDVPVATLIWPKPSESVFAAGDSGVYSDVFVTTRSTSPPSAALPTFPIRSAFSCDGSPLAPPVPPRLDATTDALSKAREIWSGVPSAGRHSRRG